MHLLCKLTVFLRSCHCTFEKSKRLYEWIYFFTDVSLRFAEYLAKNFVYLIKY